MNPGFLKLICPTSNLFNLYDEGYGIYELLRLATGNSLGGDCLTYLCKYDFPCRSTLPLSLLLFTDVLFNYIFKLRDSLFLSV
jgi:hypothetical protein